MSKDIIIITNGNLPSSVVLSGVVNHYPDRIAAVYLTTKLPGKKRSNTSEAIEIIRRSGIGYLSFKLLYNKLLPLFFPKAMLERRCKKLGIPLRPVASANAADVIDEIRVAHPKILISVSATHKFSQELLEIPKFPINLHYAILPAYGGLSPYVWQLVKKEKLTGVTVHIMNNILDSGNILKTEEIKINGDSALSLLFRQAATGRDLLLRVTDELLEDRNISPHPQDLSKRSYYQHPKKADIDEMSHSGIKLWTFRDFKLVAKTSEKAQ